MKALSLRYKFLFRHPLFFLILGMAPCLAVTLHFLNSKQKQLTLKEEICYLDRKNCERKQRVEREGNVIERLKGADPDYVQKTLETFTTLKGEIQRIEAILLDQPDDRTLVERLNFLKGGANRLQFREKNFQRVGNLQEVDVIQENPVEMGREDLKILLSKLEYTPIGPYSPDAESPDFLIERFELIRKQLSKDDETFVINLNCIKREYIHE